MTVLALSELTPAERARFEAAFDGIIAAGARHADPGYRQAVADELLQQPEADFPHVPPIRTGTKGTAVARTDSGTAPADSAVTPESAGGPFDDDRYAYLRDELAAERAEQLAADREWLTDYWSR